MVAKSFEHQNSRFGLSPERRLIGLFLFALVSLTALSFSLWKIGKEIQSLTISILENRETIRTTEQILYRLSEIVNMSREYAALGKPASLEAKKHYTFFPESLKKIQDLTREDQQIQKTIVGFCSKVESRVERVKKRMETLEREGPVERREQVIDQIGMSLMSEISVLGHEIIGHQESILKVELKSREQMLKDWFVYVAGFSLFSLMGLVYSFGRVRSQLGKIRSAEQKSQKARQELQNIIDTVRDPLLILDGNLKLKGASRSFYDTFSLSPEDTENRFLYELRGREWDIPELRTLLVETLLQKGEIRDFEVKNIFPDLGQKTWLVSARQLSSGIPGLPNILVSLKDITERTVAESILRSTNLELIELRNELEKRVAKRTEELRKSEEFLRQAIRVGKFGLFDHDQVHERIYWSEEERTMLGFEERETYQFTEFASRVHPEDLEAVLSQVAEAHDPKGPGMLTMDHRVCLPDGTIRWISHRAQTYFEGEGENRRAVRTIGVSLDITEQKKTESLIKTAMKRLAEEKAKLEESNRGLERFAAIAAHDLRAPIRSMGLWVEILEGVVPKPWNQEIEQALQFIKFNSNKSLALVQDLLEIAKVKPDVSGWETIDTYQLVNQVLTTFKTEIETSKAKVTVDKLPAVEGIVWQVESVLSNLIRNALTYRERSRAPEIEISCKEKPEYFLFQVKDNGIGIPLEFHKRIFEMFERLHAEEEYPGTGIGLALCKKLVESWGGEMCLDSAPGRGSSFYFTYPKKKAALERKSA